MNKPCCISVSSEVEWPKQYEKLRPEERKKERNLNRKPTYWQTPHVAYGMTRTCLFIYMALK